MIFKYDIIGDIHGESDLLHQMLHQLGYRPFAGTYRHDTRKVIFLGDFINKGPHTREVLFTVRKMVEASAAHAVLGNHECNLLGYFSRNKAGEYIRPHTEKNTQQLQATLDSFGQDQDSLHDYLHWLQRLPLFWENDLLRVAHAYWHQHSVDFIRSNFPKQRLDSAVLGEMTADSPATSAVQKILVGIKLPLPQQALFKTKWWKIGRSHRYQDLAIRPDDALGNPCISTEDVDVEAYQYPGEAKPLIFGHYNLPGLPRLLAPNYTCLDFSQDSRRYLTAYRWDGEQKLDENKIVYC